MRVLALDIGEKRIGVAVSDVTGTVATPLVVLDAKAALGDGLSIKRVADDYEVELLVVGLPRSLDGTEGPQAAKVRSAAKRIESLIGLPVAFVDERLSSSEATKAMSSAGMTERDMRGRVDMVAAALFLQTYLDAERTRDSEGR
ncbi:MAG: Holliday junction resolvase RuvX [Coriobacteriia bacterium]|nr:Holliday junction resolvase RuvX [Coriobacteriia bacterium]